MYMQRIHVKLQEAYPETFPYDTEISDILENIDYNNRKTFGLKDSKENFSWRPFQLAFLLMSVISITEPESEDRELVDLIWFPTGGGKTEAYLGLTAFTIFHRRLVDPTNGGTTVMMRYTLRLLTSQQFTRAATLICACEKIRREENVRFKNYNLGKEPITIGLWIGGDHIPNTNKKAEAEYKEFLSDLWKQVAGDDKRTIDEIIDKKELREKLTDDDREGIDEAYRNAQQRTLWERLTNTNHKDVTFYKGLLEEYTRELLFCLRHDFLEEI
jgi:hypothetical protein